MNELLNLLPFCSGAGFRRPGHSDVLMERKLVDEGEISGLRSNFHAASKYSLPNWDHYLHANPPQEGQAQWPEIPIGTQKDPNALSRRLSPSLFFGAISRGMLANDLPDRRQSESATKSITESI